MTSDFISQMMDCPFLSGLYTSRQKTAKQFLCTPSLYRLDILAWLFTRLYPSFQESFEAWQDSNDEDKIIELTKLGNELMLCGPNDQDLIKGCVRDKRQLGFMKELLTLIENMNTEFSGNFSSMGKNMSNLKQKEGQATADLHKEITGPKSNSVPQAAESHLEKEENRNGKAMESKKSKVEELSDKLTKLTEMLQTHNREVFNSQDRVNRLFYPGPSRFHKQDSRAANGVTNTSEEGTTRAERPRQGKGYFGRGNFTGMQPQNPKPVTSQNMPFGLRHMGRGLGNSHNGQ
uniref:Uncharacterized protein n=1 Tax=Monodelphis domestica TaxID=13616 RepID=A0A5F8GQR4_MONDO